MVFSRSDVKRRNKDVQDPLIDNPKRTKVHAQRKFAQGSGMNSPVKEMNFIKEKDRAKPEDDISEELPTNQPPTEDFLSFLCFRGTQFLSPRLSVFNEVSHSQRKNSCSSKRSGSSSGSQKHKAGIQSEDYKKRLTARHSGLQKGNAVRARTASNERQAVRKKAIERQLRRKAEKRRVKPIRKTHPAILKRLTATRHRVGLRSAGQLPPGSDIGLTTDRKPKRGRPKQQRPALLKKNKMENESKKRIAKDKDAEFVEDIEDSEDESEEDEDVDNAEVVEKEKCNEKHYKEGTTKSTMGLRTRGSSNSPAQSSKKARPTRKTKEAATLYMEMLTKDLRNPDEEDEDYVRNFPELPSTIKRDKQGDTKNNSAKKGRLSRRDISPLKDDKSKIKNFSKEASDVIDNMPLLKRKQRSCVKKVLKRKVVVKLKGRPSHRAIPLKSRNTASKMNLRARTSKRRAIRNSHGTDNEDIEDESDEEEGEEEEELEEPFEPVKKKNNKKSASGQTKGRVTRNSDQKKVFDTLSIKGKQKKRISAPVSSSVSESEEEVEIDSFKREDKSFENKRKLGRTSERKKSLKVDNYDNSKTPKRMSSRNIKKEASNSDIEEFNLQKERTPRRSKRIKESDEEENNVKKGKFSDSRKSKYKEDSDVDLEDEYTIVSKTRSSLRQKLTNKEIDDDVQKNKVVSKKFNDDVIEINVKKSRGKLQKHSNDKEQSDTEVELPFRKSRNSTLKKSVLESDEEDDEPLIKKTRGKIKSDADVSSKRTESNEDSVDIKKKELLQLKKSVECDEDIQNISRKVRASLLKKNTYSDETNPQDNFLEEVVEQHDNLNEKHRTSVGRKPKRPTLEKESSPDSEVIESNDNVGEKSNIRLKPRKCEELQPKLSFEEQGTLVTEIMGKPVVEVSNKKQKKLIKENKEETSDADTSHEIFNDNVSNKIITSEENNKDTQNLESKSRNRKGKKPKKNPCGIEKEIDDVSEEAFKRQRKSDFSNLKIDVTLDNAVKILHNKSQDLKESKDGPKITKDILLKSNHKEVHPIKKENVSELKTKFSSNTVHKSPENLDEQANSLKSKNSNLVNLKGDLTNEKMEHGVNIKKEKDDTESCSENISTGDDQRKARRINSIKLESNDSPNETDNLVHLSKKALEVEVIKKEGVLIANENKDKKGLSNLSQRETKKDPTNEKLSSNELQKNTKESSSRKSKKSLIESNNKSSLDASSQGSSSLHKAVRPFSYLEKSEESKGASLSTFSNVDIILDKHSNICKYPTDNICEKISKNVCNKNEVNSCTETICSPEVSKQKSNEDNMSHIKKTFESTSKKLKNSASLPILDEPKNTKISPNKNLSGGSKDILMKHKENDLKKGKEFKLGTESCSAKDNPISKRQTRLSFISPERERGRKFDEKEKMSLDFISSSEVEREPKPKVGRKPSLTARAQFITHKDEDDDSVDMLQIKPNNDFKPAAPGRRKSHGGRDSCDTIGSGSSSIVDCKVVLNDISQSLGEKSGDVLKSSKKAKNLERVSDKSFLALTAASGNEFSSKDHFTPASNIVVHSGNCEAEKVVDRTPDREKIISKPSIGDTWRQAFKNVKIPKPGHLSPVPHSVEPFMRQKPKFPNLSGSFNEKSKDSDQKSGETSKTAQSLSPFKARLASQSQRSMSPDPKKHLSPAHKVNFSGYESPVRRNEDLKIDYKKQEPPVKSLTQLQYEKRSSEFINSYLDHKPPPVLPAFESIRAYKKEMKKDELKESVKIEPLSQAPIPEPAAKPNPEGKHLNLPLAVEHTLRKNSPITVSKKPPLKPVSFPPEKRLDNIPVTKPILPCGTTEKKVVPPPPLTPTNPGCPHPPSRDILVQEPPDLSSLSKKKVNMSTEEINRWLNDSTSSGIEHKRDCGIFENHQCECSYRTSESSMQNSVGVSELVPKDEKIDHGVVEPPVQLKELDKGGKYVAETISTCKVEEYKEKLLSKNPPDNKMVPPKVRRSSGHDRPKSNRSMTEEEMCEYDFRFERMSNSPRESVSDVSSLTHRDDASVSSEIPERKIFHQKRTGSVSKRLSISSPAAFSAENESSIYAFKPDPPSTVNKPFRRGRGKSGDIEDGKHISSSSIAVQVNLNENEAGGLECSTQTERPSDENEGHLFYIPLPDEQLQSGLPQGVAVKLDKEGPDQRVIMRAKLVTKPNNTFSSASASNSRTFLNSGQNSHQKPEQKVRPLWSVPGHAPVGTVQPTLREPDTNDEEETQEKPTVSGQFSQTSQSTQITQQSLKQPDSPRTSRSSTKIQKQSVESKALTETIIPSAPPTAIEWKGTEFPPSDIPATLVEAPTFYPTEKEFQDPLEYIEQLTPLAQSFGICRIVPPSSFKPECKVSDDMRFTAYNQYVHKLMERWGPNVKELCAIKKYLTTQSINLTQLPLIGSMEVDLPRLYQTVQQHGGLKEVIEKKRWARVADAMRIPKTAQDRLTKLDDIYCKYLLPYDTLSHEERTKLLDEVEEEWKEREKRLAAEEDSGNNGSGDGSDESSDNDDTLFECISKGKNMPLSAFFRIARNTMYTWFKDSIPNPAEVESEFWKHVSTKNYHVCVHCGSIDSGTWGYGFPTTKTSATSRHPWNLKVLTNSPGSILRSLGPVIGVTVPTLHVGMLFSSCCWYRDPHALPWIEYLHTGASKIWYGIPGSRATELRNAMYPLLPRHTRDKPIWLPSDTMMVPPQYLMDNGVSICRVVQDPGQFILVFPKAFTSTIATGYIVSESVYFAQPSWLSSALQVFKDIQDSCEPPVFSLHKLLFSIANDTRASADVLNQILPMLTSVVENEVELRKSLEKLGLTSWERLPSSKSGRRTKKQEEEASDLECDTCRGVLFLSMVTNSNEDCSYCVDHAIETLSKDNSLLKYCKLLYAYDEEEMEELIDKVNARIEAKSQKKQKEKSSSSGTKN